MARLPDPEMDQLAVSVGDNYESAQDEVNKTFARVIRRMINEDKRKEEEKDEY